MNQDITVKELLDKIDKEVKEITENVTKENAKKSVERVQKLGFLEGNIKGYLMWHDLYEN